MVSTVHNITQLCESTVILLQENKNLLGNTAQEEIGGLEKQGENPL